mmetsp:Transcript_25089/g.50176  ORF Transcript_25089/g.50176 Transcript_25089/m.50176 type:complete len:740 (-) Transcript_25089:732-2951(-)
MEINVHAGGTIIPIILPLKKCTSTSWGELCQDVVNNYLTAADPKLILQILTKISPTERLTHYLIRYGDGGSSIIRVDWSSTDIPGFIRLPLVPAYIDVNMTLKPRVRGALQNIAKPHLPLQPAGISLPTSVHVDLCIALVSTEEPPLSYDERRMSVLYLEEHRRFPGCVDTFNIVGADGQNNILPGTARMPDASSAAAAIIVTAANTTAAAGKKRKAPSKDQTAAFPNTKAKTSKEKKEEAAKSDDNDGAKKPATKEVKGGAAAAAAAKKKSTPKESSAAGLKSPPKKSGLDMIRVYKEAKELEAANAKELEAARAKQLEESSSSKLDSASIPKVISSRKTTKTSLKKDKGKTTAAKDSAKKPSTIEVGRDRAPSANVGSNMIRLYNETKEANAAGKENTSSKKSDVSTKSSSSKKTTKGSSKKEAKSNEGKSADKPSSAAASEKSREDKTPSVDVGNKMIRLYEEAKAKKLAESSPKTDPVSIPKVISSKKTTKISSKKDKKKANAAEDSAKKPSAATATKEVGERSPSAAVGNDMIRLHNDFSAEAKAAGTETTSSKKSDNSTTSSSSKKAKGSSKKDETKSNEGKSAEKSSPLEEEKPPGEADVEGAKASKNKRKATTDAMTSDVSKSASRKKAKTSKANEISPSKVTFAADVKKSDASKKVKPSKKKKSPAKKSTGNEQKQKLVHCGVCDGCVKKPCRKCIACIANPKKRCKRRPCNKPSFVGMAEYLAIMAKTN